MIAVLGWNRQQKVPLHVLTKRHVLDWTAADWSRPDARLQSGVQPDCCRLGGTINGSDVSFYPDGVAVRKCWQAAATRQTQMEKDKTQVTQTTAWVFSHWSIIIVSGFNLLLFLFSVVNWCLGQISSETKNRCRLRTLRSEFIVPHRENPKLLLHLLVLCMGRCPKEMTLEEPLESRFTHCKVVGQISTYPWWFTATVSVSQNPLCFFHHSVTSRFSSRFELLGNTNILCLLEKWRMVLENVLCIVLKNIDDSISKGEFV